MKHVMGLVIVCVVVAATLTQLTTSVNSSIPSSWTSSIITKPGCPSQCGNVTVPYPFGIGIDCSFNNRFYITCNTTFNPPKAFIASRSIEIFEISPTQMRIGNWLAYKCYESAEISNRTGNLWNYTSVVLGTGVLPYSYSDENVFTLVGCDDYGYISGTVEDDFNSGCSSRNYNAEDVPTDECLGVCCCQVSVKALRYYTISLTSFSNHTNVSSFNPCGYGFLGEKSSFKFRGLDDLNDPSFVSRTEASVPIVLDWAIVNQNCEEARNSSDSNFACVFNNTECIDSSFGGYHCSCSQGYEGFPYLTPGCHDINECDDPNKNECVKESSCVNTPGSYNCSCPPGYDGDGKINGRRCIAANTDKSNFPLRSSLGVGLSSLFVFTGISWLFFIIKGRKATQLKQKFFLENGGILLRQRISNEGRIDSTREFTIAELKKATNNYSDDNIIGQGGYGTVYKGILVDQRVVAIKKSRVMDKSQVEQFINEVVILTNINHRNVVKLLGCCLECEVPMLVYEFVSNGSLFEHIHENKGMPWLSLENRLRIAAESAGALAYLHSAASPPIIHRDVKSANILLDEHNVTKISDFGASRLVPLDHLQVTTLVQGTLGYLDPEYFHSGQLTDKSDVYSFGVVLAELLTGRKPLYINGPQQERNLATYFIMYVKKNKLFQVLDPQLKRDGSIEQLQAVAQLVIRCLNLNGDQRPTMKEVAMELEGLRKFTKHPWINDQHNHKERTSMINIELEPSDLYNIQLSSSATFGKIRKSFSNDTA